MLSSVRDHNRRRNSHAKAQTISFQYSQTYLFDERELPFKVELVSEAKCHERVFAAGTPTTYI